LALVLLASAASTIVILGELRALRRNFDLLTGVYAPLQLRLGEAAAQSARIGAQVQVWATASPSGMLEERDLVLFADALGDRRRLVSAVAEPLDAALSAPTRFGGEEALGPARALREQLEALSVAVALDESDDPVDVLADVRRQSEINRAFRALAEDTAETVEAQRGRVEAAGKTAEGRIIALAAAVAILAVITAAAVMLTLRPLRRLSSAVRKLSEGQWEERIELGGRGPAQDDEVARLAREFNLMAAALEERERRLLRGERLAAIGRLAAQITHEIRNPLSSVALNTELLEDEMEGASAEARRLLARIQAEVDRLAGITEEYLALARRPRPELVELDLRSVISDLLEFLAEEHAAASVVVEALLDAPLHVRGDAGQLRQALLNLLRNAREAATEAASRAPPDEAAEHLQIRVEGSLTAEDRERSAGEGAGPHGSLGTSASLAEEGGGLKAARWVIVRVVDHGLGIAQEDRERVFEAFYSRKSGGTGLGLSTVQEVIGDHGGAVRVAESSENGTTFEVALPACAPPDASVSSPLDRA
jgi:signal transduction histidine kinase